MRALEINFKESIFLIYKIHTCEHLEFVNFVWVLINVPVYSVVINLDSGLFFLLLNILGIYIISSYSFYNLSDPVWHSLPCVCLHIERLKKIFQLNIFRFGMIKNHFSFNVMKMFKWIPSNLFFHLILFYYLTAFPRSGGIHFKYYFVSSWPGWRDEAFWTEFEQNFERVRNNGKSGNNSFNL